MENNWIENFKKHNLYTRTISAAVLVPAVLFLVYNGGFLYFFAIVALFAVMMKEWGAIYTNKLKHKLPIHKMLLSKPWFILGSLYLLVPSMLMLLIRLLVPSGMELMFWLLFCVWATDIGGYFAGISIGGPKIAPKISPNKTWAGLAGAIVCSSLIGYIFSWVYPNDEFPYFGASLFLPIVAQAGDFLESAIKRRFEVKDSGTLIPGHGGVLDRVDGLLSATILTWILCIFYYL